MMPIVTVSLGILERVVKLPVTKCVLAHIHTIATKTLLELSSMAARVAEDAPIFRVQWKILGRTGAHSRKL